MEKHFLEKGDTINLKWLSTYGTKSESDKFIEDLVNKINEILHDGNILSRCLLQLSFYKPDDCKLIEAASKVVKNNIIDEGFGVDKTVKFSGALVEHGGIRKPNEKEMKEKFIHYIRFLHFTQEDFMSTQMYYSLKGMIRHGNYEPVHRYLDKVGLGYRDSLDNYMNTVSIIDYKVKLSPTLLKPIQYSVCEVDTENRREDNE